MPERYMDGPDHEGFERAQKAYEKPIDADAARKLREAADTPPSAAEAHYAERLDKLIDAASKRRDATRYTDEQIDEIVVTARGMIERDEVGLSGMTVYAGMPDDHPYLRKHRRMENRRELVATVVQLRRDLDAARCGPKGDGTSRVAEFSTALLVSTLRDLANAYGKATTYRAELLAAADRLAAMFNAFITPCSHEIERDAAQREIERLREINSAGVKNAAAWMRQAKEFESALDETKTKPKYVLIQERDQARELHARENESLRTDNARLNGEIIELRRQLNDARNDLAMERLGKEAASA